MDSFNTSYETSLNSSVDAGTNAAVMGVMAIMYLLALIVGIIVIVSMWKIFTKAGKPGWAAIVPVYREIVQLEIAGRPTWWVLLMMFVPFFGTWVAVVALIDFVRSYQRSGLWVLFMAFVPFVAYPMFAFSEKTKYRGPVAAGRTDFMPAPVPAAGAPVYQPPQPVAPTTPTHGQPQPPVPPQA